MTGFSNEEEKAVGRLEIVPFTCEDAMTELGAVYDCADNWQCNVEVSERLVTGQNPASAEATAQAVLDLLAQNGRREYCIISANVYISYYTGWFCLENLI